MYRSSKHVLIFLYLLFSFSLYPECLLLPHALTSKAVYYIKSKQLDAFSCGYNVLFNAANFEYCCGFPNDVHRYEVFAKKSLPYIKGQGYDPKNASYNTQTEHLAQKILKLQPFFHLHYDKQIGKIGILLSGETRITYPQGISKKEIEQRMDQAVAQRKKQEVASIKNLLNATSNVVIHFLCYLDSLNGTRHCVLLSLCQNETGRGLYLFDNLNEPLSYSSEVLRFIEYLSQTFLINPRDSFVGPSLPHRWPHLDSADRGEKRRPEKRRSVRSGRD